MKKIIVLLISFCFVQLLFSQNKFRNYTSNYKEVSYARNFRNNVRTLNPNEYRVNNRIVDISAFGDAIYWRANFAKGKIIDNENEAIIDVYMRYRIIDDKFEIKTTLDDTEIYTLDRSNRFDLIIDGVPFTFLKDLPLEINDANNGYSMVLVVPADNKAGLYKRMYQLYTPAKKPVNPLKPREDAELELQTTYFLSVAGETVVIEPHKRRAVDSFPDQKDKLKKYMDKNNLKFRSNEEEEDLISLVQYYNSLK